MSFLAPPHDQKRAPSVGAPSPATGGSPPTDEDGFTDTTEEWVRDGRAEIITGPPHPGRLPKSPARTPEERQIDDLARLRGRPLTEQEANLAIDRARWFGEL